ncbi:MAG: transporter substrate-binding domain-containing protein, partial [Desulfotignum sp.]|nr:transporter substrate-binding domain-containing protein [Desulfotignum sp.]
MTSLLRKKKNMTLCMGLFFLALCVVHLPCGAAEEEPLTVVYNPGRAPMKFVNQAGGAAGMLPDIWRAIGSKMNRPVEFVRAQDFDESLDMIKTGRADLHAGLFRTQERETWLTYTTAPLCRVEYFIFTSQLIFPVTHLEELGGIQVGITRGGYTQEHVVK